MSKQSTRLPTMKTDLDDWETDPDFIRDMDETDQRWGSKRTVGSINMNELIDEVRKDHKIMREKFDHSSQKDHSDGFGGKFGIQRDRKDQSAHDFDYHEKLSKHTSQEISRKVITSSSSVTRGGGVSDAKRNFLDRSENTYQKPAGQPTSDDIAREIRSSRLSNVGSSSSKSPIFEDSSTTRRVFHEEKSSSSSSHGPSDLPPAFKSIQEKINAFKKEFDDTKSEVAKKSELSKIIKKTTKLEKKNDVEYLTRTNKDSANGGDYQSTSSRPTSTSPLSSGYMSQREMPKNSIKSLSEKFETLCRDDGEDFKRRTEAKRKEFFDQIKNQVRETRKDLDGFDSIDEEYIDSLAKMREKLERSSPNFGKAATNLGTESSPTHGSRPSSRLSSEGSQLNRPKVYTRREVTQEEIVSRVVKENDKVIQNETKRNVERSSSCHGSSDEGEDNNGPSSIRFIEHKLNNSPVRVDSPVDRIKRQVPIVEPEIKGAGLMARTLYDYQASEADELSFDVDDLITNIEKIDPGWYKGTIIYRDGSRRIGLFPANYVRLLNDASEH